MARDLSYAAVLGRRAQIMRRALGLDYRAFERTPVAFDYEAMMATCPYDLEAMRAIQREMKAADTPLWELRQLTRLARQVSPTGHAARLFLKDEAANAGGSLKARRASLAVHEAARAGYRGVCAATSGNYGGAVACQAAQRNLRCIVLQELFDSRFRRQPEIEEKLRLCEAFGAEVIQLSVGPELFYWLLVTIEETGYYNASLYTPLSIAGMETLGVEIAEDLRRREGRPPDAVVVTHAGGGNVTGTARGLRRAGADRTRVIGASVDLTGLHMASDRDFNLKSFTTGHTGFGVPFAVWPDRVDVPRSAARPLRYLDAYVTVTQGEVFYLTELLAALEGLERGPAGNTALAAAFALAQRMDNEQLLVVQESEYTGAGKAASAQLTFARDNGVTVRRGPPEDNAPGRVIAIPEHPAQVRTVPRDLDALRRSYLAQLRRRLPGYRLTPEDVAFLAADLNVGPEFIERHTPPPDGARIGQPQPAAPGAATPCREAALP